MSEYSNENRGVLFRNHNKEKDTQPDYRGSINVDGKELWLSAWLKEAGPGSKNHGEKFFSLSVQPKEDRDRRAGELKQAARPVEMDDEIPFAPETRG